MDNKLDLSGLGRVTIYRLSIAIRDACNREANAIERDLSEWPEACRAGAAGLELQGFAKNARRIALDVAAIDKHYG